MTRSLNRSITQLLECCLLGLLLMRCLAFGADPPVKGAQYAGQAQGLGQAQGPAPTRAQAIDYTLDLREPSSHLVRVTMTVRDAAASTEIQFPAWNDLYYIRDFVRHVQDLAVRCDGQLRELLAVDLYTWRAATEPCVRLEVSYAVYANEEGVFSCVLNDEHAFMNFAQLLFYVAGEGARGARVRFLLPQGWNLTTLLDEGDTPGEFKTASYDSLADSPTEAGPAPEPARRLQAGQFQEYSYVQKGATYRVVVHSDPAAYSSEKLLESIKKITAAETALMREIPFSRYTFILHFPPVGGGGGMEHSYGSAISFPAGDLRTRWEGLEATIAHEFFHLWNVKRIRPQGLEPIDYVHGNDTRDLWFSEGVTSTYQELVLLRAGLIKRQRFYERLAGEIARLQERPARHFQSVELSGLEAWLERYPDYFRSERSISYYNKGALLGFLLDLGIRNASRNQHSLDDVMRRLNEDFARRGRFFTQSDLRTLVAGLVTSSTGASTWVEILFRDYVSGTHELDYDTYLGYAGLRLLTERVERAALGFVPVRTPGGPIQVESVDPGSGAEKAGLKPGDILTKIDGQEVTELPQDLLRMKPSQKIQLQVRRRSQILNFTFSLGSTRQTTYRIQETPNASEDQLRVRQGWLEGRTSER